MIISNIIGGLGNQMFQYAAGRSLSLQRAQPLRLDLSGFDGYGLHNGFELQQVFDCPVEVANEADVRNVLGWQYPPMFRRVLARPWLVKFRRGGLVMEPHFHYWQGLSEVPDDSYLVGYWQSEKYFQKIASVIRADFTFKSPLSGRNSELGQQIGQVSAVSLHCRRGDYVDSKKTNALLGLCSLDYYRAAIDYISRQVDNPNFFMFSDDIAWLKDNLHMDFPCHYVEHNHGRESYNDMHLMSLCQHHIIANSSFSWWGAWLNPRLDKIVIAPRRWFAKENNEKDLLPQGWVTL